MYFTFFTSWKVQSLIFVLNLLHFSIQEENTEKNEDEKPSKTKSEGDVKLPAGSLVLAVVNEAGSLVPYVDVETVSEKNPGNF